MRDDNSQWKQEQDEEEQWYEKNSRLLNEFDKLQPLITGKKNDQKRDTAETKTPF